MAPAMRACFVTGAYPPAVCGIGDYTANLCAALAKRGLELSIVTSSYLGVARREVDNPAVFPVVDSWHMHQARKAIRAINHVEPDVVIFQIPHLEYRRRIFCNVLIPLVKAFRPSAKIVVTFHEILELREVSWKKTLNIARVIVSVAGADAVVLIAPSYTHTFQGVIHKVWPPSRRVSLHVIPVVSNIRPSMLSAFDLSCLRETLGFSGQSLLLTYFGFINADKGFDDALRVLSALCERHIAAHLLVIGRLDPADPYHRTMQQLITQSKLESDVTVTGFVSADRVADYLAMSDACVLPFRSGVHAKSSTFLAARAQGVFTITTSANGPGYADLENVYYSRPGDIEAMASAICRYMGRKLGCGEARRVSNWDQTAERYHKVFQDLISKGED
jgi:polysaccharide biosynthesis protein PslF